MMKKISYQLVILFVLFSLLVSPVAPAFAQEGAPETATPTVTVTETPTEAETPVTEVAIGTETQTAEPATLTPAVPETTTPTPSATISPTATAALLFSLTLSSNPNVLKKNGKVNLIWEIQGVLPKKSEFVLQISLPQGFTADLKKDDGTFDPTNNIISIPITKNKGEIKLQSPENRAASYFTADLQDGTETLAKAEYFLPLKEEFKVRKSGGSVDALDGKLKVKIPADTFAEDVTLEIGEPSQESMPADSLSGQPFEITATGDASRESLHEFENEKQVEFEIQYEDFIDVPEGMEGSLHVWWYNTETEEWEIINSVADAESGTIKAVSDHFSLFDIGLNSWNASRVPSTDAFQVSEFTGAGSYSQPIEVPAGPGGFQPNLSLNYNSQVVDGSSLGTQASWVGMGWSLDVGSIELDYRGANNSTFILSVGGVSSHIYKDANGKPHVAEENGWDVQLLGTSPSTYWLVKDTQGNTYKFDYQVTAPIDGCSVQQEHAWYLTQQTNKYNQSINYAYDGSEKKTVACGPNLGHITPTTAVYLQSVTYNDRYRVRFLRNSIGSPRGDYSSADEADQGFHMYMKTYLQNIVVEQDTSGNGSFSSVNVIRSYGLDYNTTSTIWPQYTYTAGGKVLTLNAVREYGLGGSTYLQTTTFEYADAMHMSKASNSYGGSVSFAYSPWVSPDAPSAQNYYQEQDQNGDQTNSVCYAPWQGWTGSGFGGIGCSGNMLSVGPGAMALIEGNTHPGGAYRVSAQVFAYTNAQARLGVKYTKPTYVNGVFSFGDFYYGPYVNGAGAGRSWPPPSVFISYTSPILPTNQTNELKVLIQASGGSSVHVPWFRAESLPTYYRISSKTVSDAPSGSSPHQYITSYAYESPATNSTNLYEASQYAEFRGHGKVTVTHADGTKTVTLYNQTDDLKGRPSQISEYDAAGKLISRQDFTYSVTSLPVSSAYTLVPNIVKGLPKRNFTYTSSTTQTAYNTNGTAVGSTMAESFYNAYYQLSQQKEYEGSNLYRVTNYEYVPNTTGNLTALPSRQYVTDAASAILAETLYIYDSNTANSSMPTVGVLKAQCSLVSNSQYAMVKYAYDDWGNQTGVTTHSGLTSANTCNPSTPPTGAATTTTTFDATYHTYPLTITNPLSQATTITYDYTKGVPLTETDANGATIKADYDAFGRMTAIYKPNPASGSFEASASLSMSYSSGYPFTTTITQANPSYFITKIYDGMGRVTQVNANGILTDTIYDSATVTRQSTPHTSAESVYYTTTTVNPSARTTTVLAPDGTSTVSASNGLSSSVTDAKGNVTTTLNDVWGRATFVDAPDGPDVSYAYDAMDRLLTVTRGGATTTLTYNNAGQKLAMNDADMGAWSYTYDALGNLKTQTDARACVLTMNYDALSRLTGKNSSGTCGTQVSTSYTYDIGTNGIGRRTSMTDASGSTSWLYDKRGRVTSETKNISGTNYVTGFGYNNADMVTSMSYPVDNETVNYHFNSQMQVDNVASLSGTYASSILYDSAGRMTHLKRGDNLLDTTYTYNPWNVQGGRLQNLTTTKVSTQTNLQNFGYNYNAVGNINSILDLQTTPQTQTFTYDSLDRLRTAVVTGGTNGLYNESYGYDATTGNLETKASLTLAYGDSNHKHAVTSAGGNNYTYDANGNMITRDINSGPLTGDYLLAYDAENRLIEVKKNNAVIATFVYDGDGKQVKATVNGEVTTYVGSHYEIKDSVVTKYYFAGSTRIALRENCVLNYLLADHLGSSSITTDANGVSTAAMLYKAWGETRYSTGDLNTDYEYTGQRNESGIGLHFYNARWYDDQLGRFVQADSIVPAGVQGYDRYAYVNNNPLRYNDPTGHIAPCGSACQAWISIKNWWSLVVHDSRQTQAAFMIENEAGEFLDGKVNDLEEAMYEAYYHQDGAEFVGTALEKIKNDPNMINSQNNTIESIQSNPKYRKESFSVPDIVDPVTFGEHGSGLIGMIIDAGYEETWMIRAAEVDATNIKVGISGDIRIDYKLIDNLDLTPDWTDPRRQNLRGWFYNEISEDFGFVWHGVFGATRKFPTSANWTVHYTLPVMHSN